NVEFARFKTIGKAWWPLLKVYEGWALKKADIVFCISDEDKQSMIRHFHLKNNQCIVVPFGITNETIPNDKAQCKQLLSEKYGFDPEHSILFFNGLLNYKPNLEALD